MEGINPVSLTQELKKVAWKHAKKPSNSIENPLEKLKTTSFPYHAHEGNYDTLSSFLDNYHKLPLSALIGFSFDELCKMYYSTIFMMHDTVRNFFETDPNYELIRKIISSMWRWGYGKGTWNEVVDMYECIRTFTFIDNPDFEIRIDHSTYHNEFGYSKYSRTFLDGVFAFLVYYKKKHVLTIGFSIMEGKRLLIQQIQLKECMGNRWLYKIPQNRTEFVISLFKKNFPGYKLFIIDGNCLIQKILIDYRNALESTKETLERYQNEIIDPKNNYKEKTLQYLKRSQEECTLLQDKLTHLECDRERIVSFYANTGQFALGPRIQKINKLIHRPVLV